MLDIIKKIIEIDHMAQKLIDDTNVMKTDAEKAIEADKAAMREQYIEKAKKRIQVNIETEENFLKKALADLEKRYNDIADRMNTAYQASRQGWVDEIYSRVIGG